MRDDESVYSSGTDASGGAGARTAGDGLRASKGSSSKRSSGWSGACTVGSASSSPPALAERSAPASLSRLRRAGGAVRGMGVLNRSASGRALNRTANGLTLTPGVLDGGGTPAGVAACGLGPDGGNNPFGPPAEKPAAQGYTPMDAGARAQMSATRDAAIERMWADQENKVRTGNWKRASLRAQ